MVVVVVTVVGVDVADVVVVVEVVVLVDGEIRVNDALLLVLLVSMNASLVISINPMWKAALVPSQIVEEMVIVACAPGMRLV